MQFIFKALIISLIINIPELFGMFLPIHSGPNFNGGEGHGWMIITYSLCGCYQLYMKLIPCGFRKFIPGVKGTPGI